MSLNVIFFLFGISIVSAKLQTCTETTSEADSSSAKLCAYHRNYSRVEYPHPLPCNITLGITINDIIDIDEELQIVKLYLTLTSMWRDTRVTLKYNQDSKPENYPWYLVIESEFHSIWKPRIVFLNSISTQLEYEDLEELWYLEPNTFYWSQTYTVNLSCRMDFSSFPFDSHNCTMKLQNAIGRTDYVLLQKPEILFNDIGESYVYEGNPARLKFQTKIQSMPSGVKKYISSVDKNNYASSLSQANVLIQLDRKKFSGLIPEFYIPTFMYSTLALISYFISTDTVPGRMGLLITLCLIAINNYVSTEAPSTRGISYFDVWFIGCLMPVVFAIIEYGTLLAIAKYNKGYINGKFIDSLVVDKAALVISLVYVIIFNIVYWIAC